MDKTLAVLTLEACAFFWAVPIGQAIKKWQTKRSEQRKLWFLHNSNGRIMQMTGVIIGGKERTIPAIFSDENDALDMLYVSESQGVKDIHISHERVIAK